MRDRSGTGSSSRSSTGSAAQFTPSPGSTSHHFPGDLLQASPQPYSVIHESHQGASHGMPHSMTMPAFPSLRLQTDGAAGYGQAVATGSSYHGNVSGSPMHHGGSEPSLHTQQAYGQRSPSSKH